LEKYLHHPEFEVLAINFATYGATLVYLNQKGERLTPVYNYLKFMPDGIVEPLYEKYGGVFEFSRCTASPSLGMLNSGLQALWLKRCKAQVFDKVKNILHFPQYLSFRLSGKITSEHTSIGCHTAMWDFDRMQYHDWLKNTGIELPPPISAEEVFEGTFENLKVNTGIGIHDSSASLAPYLRGSKDDFILLSTGTWCISMNPFNHTPLSTEQLEKDCLCYMSINQKPVKSSRVFLGHIHDVNLERLVKYFKVDSNEYKKVKTNEVMLKSLMNNSKPNSKFFGSGMKPDYIDSSLDLSLFANFEEAYHRLMIDLSQLVVDSIALIIPENDTTRCLYVSGGFAKNELFTRILADSYPNKQVYTSEINNATSLGAALVLYKQFGLSSMPDLDLHLKRVSRI
jgi:sugar (pentulose or hexulose) kinase